MGRWRYSHRDTVEECLIIDIYFLKKHNYLKFSQNGEIQWSDNSGFKSSMGIKSTVWEEPESITFSYTVTKSSTNEKEDFNYTIPLVKTSCNFGGFRYWFKCQGIRNNIYCGRRVAKLYRAPSGNYFICRHCYDLTYYLRRKKGSLTYSTNRIKRKLDKIEQKIRKKGIHYKTFQRLKQEQDYLIGLQGDYYLLEIQKLYEGL